MRSCTIYGINSGGGLFHAGSGYRSRTPYSDRSYVRQRSDLLTSPLCVSATLTRFT